MIENAYKGSEMAPTMLDYVKSFFVECNTIVHGLHQVLEIEGQMLTISAKADIAKIRRLFPTADVQRTTMYQDYRRYPVIVVQFATRAEEQAARALVTGKGKDDDQHA